MVVAAYCVAMTVWIWLWAAPTWDRGTSLGPLDEFVLALGFVIHIAAGYFAGRWSILLLAFAPTILSLPFSEDCSDEWLCFPLSFAAFYFGLMLGLPSLALGVVIHKIYARRRGQVSAA